MAGKFLLKKFSDININDEFFDSLKEDYPGTENSTGFIDWFKRKTQDDAAALVFEDDIGIGAFIVLKPENEEIKLRDASLPKMERLKISTFRISERYRRQRIGEGAIGLLLWKWLQLKCTEIYLTVFNKHTTLISLLEKFGFQNRGINLNGEIVFVKSRKAIDFSNPYKAFPFIKDGFDYAGYIIIDDHYHDTMFAYSELSNVESLQSDISKSVSNGLSKIYVGKAAKLNHKIGEPVLVYRRYTNGSGKRYRSCITSYCIVTNVVQAKVNNKYLMSFDELKHHIGNKSVFDEAELKNQYDNDINVTVVEMLYYGYFGAGNNVNMDWLDKNGYWTAPNQYPTEIHLTAKQFKEILMEGNVNVSNVIVN